jgi:hypothetical protein
MAGIPRIEHLLLLSYIDRHNPQAEKQVVITDSVIFGTRRGIDWIKHRLNPTPKSQHPIQA